MATKAPHGIGHALTAIAENEIGICSIKIGEKDFDQLVQSLSTKPHRPIFLKKENEIEEKSVLTVGTTSLPAFENCEELIHSLYDQ